MNVSEVVLERLLFLFTMRNMLLIHGIIGFMCIVQESEARA